MSTDDVQPMREYVGIVWVEDEPGIRIRLMASSVDEAEQRIVEEYGEGCIFSLWNEGDASKAR